MPEPASLPALEDDLMYSPPPSARDLRWWAQRSLDALGRLLFGVVICALAVGVILLVLLILVYAAGFFLHFVPNLQWPFR